MGDLELHLEWVGHPPPSLGIHLKSLISTTSLMIAPRARASWLKSPDQAKAKI